MNTQFSKNVMKHFMHPKNMGEIAKPDGVGEVGNPKCGDVMRITIKVEKKNDQEIIKDIKFKTFGCVTAIANSSVLTTLVKGKTLEEAQKITHKEILKELGEVPKIKIHCSCLADEALKKAIKDYKNKKRS
jgi:nitrogen fixation NifU-like protein